MKYLLLSDIHGSASRLQTVLDIYRHEHCDMLLLLGDILNYGPRNGLPDGLDARAVADMLNPFADEIVAVRGNCDSEVDQMLLRFPIMGTYSVLVDEGRKIFLTHGHIYNKENMPPGHFDAVIYGHTHLWELGSLPLAPSKGGGKIETIHTGQPIKCQTGQTIVSQTGQTIVCNTGSITFPKGGKAPTFGMMDGGVITIRDLQDNVLAEARM